MMGVQAMLTSLHDRDCQLQNARLDAEDAFKRYSTYLEYCGTPGYSSDYADAMAERAAELSRVYSDLRKLPYA